jgi:glycerate 2-kinase
VASHSNQPEHDPRLLLERAYQAAVAAADPAAVLNGALPAPPRGRLLVVGAGKAAAPMAAAVERHYGDEVRLGGLVIAPEAPVTQPPRRIEVATARHPVPDGRGVAATGRLLRLVAECDGDDHVLVLVSGGGSALLCAPDGIGLDEKESLTRDLLRSGASIQEMNAVRKHLSKVKGGRLGLAAAASVTALVLSDVVGDDLSTIASGPTVADASTFADALAVLDRYGITAPCARALLEEGSRGERPETPKPGDGSLDHVETRLVGNNRRSLEAAARVLEDAGYRAQVLSSEVTGEASKAAAAHATMARRILSDGQPLRAPCALISGGETTVTVRGGGRGGRNSEFALALALELPPRAPLAALAADTDGIDGSEENAGVFLTPALLEHLDRKRAAALLEANDSYAFFQEAGHLLVTGPTGTNVNDLRILLIGSPGPVAER